MIVKIIMKKVASKVAGLNVNSSFPPFSYFFEKADIPIEMPEAAAEKLLKNEVFYLSNKEVEKIKKVPQIKPRDEKSWLQELKDVKGVGSKRASDIIAVYPMKHTLLEAIAKNAKIPFRDDIVRKLKKEFIH